MARVLYLLCICACIEPVAGVEPLPDWIGTSARLEGDVFYGVGEARGIKNPTIAATAADNRARDEVVQAAVEKLGKLSAAGKQRIVISDRHRDEETGVSYSRARLSLEDAQADD